MKMKGEGGGGGDICFDSYGNIFLNRVFLEKLLKRQYIP